MFGSDIIHSPPPVGMEDTTSSSLSGCIGADGGKNCGCCIELKGEIAPFVAKDSPALDFISRIIPVRPNKNILKAVAAVLSAVTGIEFRRHHKKSLQNIIQWFDLNLELLEPFAPYLIVETNFSNEPSIEDDDEDNDIFNDPPENEQTNENTNSSNNENVVNDNIIKEENEAEAQNNVVSNETVFNEIKEVVENDENDIKK